MLEGARARALACIALLPCAVACQTAVADSDAALRAFEAGKRAAAEQEYEDALRAFEAARDAGLAGPAVHYNIGVAAYRLGRYDVAESAFRAAAETPSMAALAHYNLGLVALARGDPSAAQGWFRAAEAAAEDPALRQLAAARLAELEARPTRRRAVAGLASLGVGNDDNVALIADADIVDVSDTEDAFVETQLAVAGPLGRAWRLDAAAFYLDYFDLDEFDQLALRGGGSYRMRLGSWSGELGLHAGYSTLDGDGFESRRTLTLQATRALGPSWHLRMRYRLSDVDGLGEFDSLTGIRHETGVRALWKGDSAEAGLEYQLELNNRDDDVVSPTRHTLATALHWELARRWTLGVDGAYRRSRYEDPANGNREEDRLVLGLDVTYALSEHWELYWRYDYTDNDSDIAEFDYSRNRLSAGIHALF